jgi:hypothetical protein
MIDTSFSTIAGLALRVMADYAEQPGMSGATGYTLHQALFKVCETRESITSASDNYPSYIWWYLGTDEHGEVIPILDLGKLACVPLRDQPRRHRYVWPREINDDDGPWAVAVSEPPWSILYPSATYAMMTMGISIGTRVCTRLVAEHYRCSYEYDDWDTRIEHEIVFIDRSPVIDVPLTFENRGPEFRGLRFE